MAKVTLLEKVYGPFSPESFEPFLSSLCKDLRVKVKVLGKTERDWVQVEVSGEDEAAALQYLNQKIGLTPTSINNIEKFFTVRGSVVNSAKTKDALCVDVGVFSPRVYDAMIPLEHLQAQLADGKDVPFKPLIELFCLLENLPLMVKIVSDINAETELIEAELAESQLSHFARWIHSSLDRLIVLGAPLRDVEHVIDASRHGRDVVKIESLGLLEHAIVCKLGTDAVGLMPKLGPHLRTATFAPFSPRKILQIIGKPWG